MISNSARAAAQYRSGIPACWAWPLPTDEDRNSIRVAWKVREDEREAYERLILMGQWQDGRCAVCGVPGGQVVHDHDHDSGLTRGYLCQTCNSREPMGGGIFVRYRHISPASICGLEFMYALPTPRAPDTEAERESVRAALEDALRAS